MASLPVNVPDNRSSVVKLSGLPVSKLTVLPLTVSVVKSYDEPALKLTMPPVNDTSPLPVMDAPLLKVCVPAVKLRISSAPTIFQVPARTPLLSIVNVTAPKADGSMLTLPVAVLSKVTKPSSVVLALTLKVKLLTKDSVAAKAVTVPLRPFALKIPSLVKLLFLRRKLPWSQLTIPVAPFVQLRSTS